MPRSGRVLKMALPRPLRVQIVVQPAGMIPRDVGIVLLVGERTAAELGLRMGEQRSVARFELVSPGSPGAALNGALLLTKEASDA